MNANIETQTAWIIHKSNIKNESKLNLRSKLSVLNYMDQSEVPVAYFEEGDYILLPKINKNVLNAVVGHDMRFDSLLPTAYHKVTYDKLGLKPMEHQVSIINNGVKHLTNNRDKRVCICARPGFGKTFVSAAIIHELKCKFVFIVYSSQLVEQTYEAFSKYLGKDGLYILSKSEDFEDLRWDKIKGLFLTHSMIQSLIKHYGVDTVVDTLANKMKCSMKIMDEYDRHVKNLYYMECWSNFMFNLYLTGTKYKNLRPDDRIFQMIYKHTMTLGHDVVLPNKRNCILIHYKFTPSSKEYMQMHQNDEKLFKTRYNDYIARKDVLLDAIMRIYYKPEDSIIKKLLSEKGSIVIYCGRIANCDIVKDKLIKNFGINEDDIGIYNSAVKRKDKDVAETKPWIITTTESMGRGYDNKNLRMLIFLEFNFGTSTYVQNVSRVARVGGDEGWVIEGIDHSFGKVIMNHKKKINEEIYSDMFKKIYTYNIPDSVYTHYKYGYRPNSVFAKEIEAYESKKKKTVSLTKLMKDI